MRNVLCIGALVAFLLVPGACLADYYGCLINHSGGAVSGTIEGFDGMFPFSIDGNRMFCQDLPEGDYTAKTGNGFWKASFSVSPDRPMKYGDGKVYWLQYIKY